MPYETYDTKDTPALESSEPQALSDGGRQAMQGRALDRNLASRGDYVQSAPLDTQDKALMTIDNNQFRPETKTALQQQGLSSEAIAADKTGDRAEAYARTVFEREGIPDGSGGMERVNRVVPGTHDGKHGIDLIAATDEGKPIPIEVKMRAEADQAQLDEKNTALEPEVQKAKEAYEQQLRAYREGDYTQLRPDAADRWKPEVADWHQRMQTDLARANSDTEGVPRLPVEQMDELWTKDRYLKLLKSDGGAERLQTAGVDPQYCQLDNFVDGNGNLIDTPLWDDILADRMTVIVSPTDDPAGKKMLDQAIFQDKSKRVLKIGL